MIETALGLVPTHGGAVLFLATFLSCLALPIPTSVLLLAGGAFVATGDLDLATVAGSAYAGAILGDQVGYAAGRIGGQRLWARLLARPRSGPLARRAGERLHRRAWLTVFLSRWLVSALGPWVNLAAGTTRVGWRSYTGASLAGEAVWVALYVGLGHAFGGRLEDVGTTVAWALIAICAVAVAFGLGRTLSQRFTPAA